MSGKEVLAVVGSFAAIGGAIGAQNQFGDQADARARAINAQACETYDSSANGGEITTHTLDCLDQAYVPGGETIQSNTLANGDPAQLLQGYVQIEQSRGKNYDAAGTLTLALIGLSAGSIFLAFQDRPRNRQTTPKETP